MPWKKNQDGLLARINFPAYTIQMLTSRHIVVGGGGGGAKSLTKSGVPNAFEIFELSHNGNNFIAEKITRYETGDNAIMNSAVYNNGKRILYVAGQESHSQLYNIQVKLVQENGEIQKNNTHQNTDGLRQRKKIEIIDGKSKDNQSFKNENNHKNTKKLEFLIKPSDSIQTDFSSDPVQRVVKINNTGTMMATGGVEGFIRLWKFPEVIQIHLLKGHTSETDDIDFNSSGKLLSTVAKDGLLIIWNTSSGKKLKEITWNIDDNKYRFKRCRFQKCLENNKKDLLFTLTYSNRIIRNKRNKSVASGFLQLWNVDSAVVEKSVAYTDSLSELAVSDDGKFVAVGTMSGTVDILIAFSLQKILHVPTAHSLCITNLEFLASNLDGPAITSTAETAVLSVSFDNKICIHSVPYRCLIPFWLYIAIVIFVLISALMVCSYLGI